MDSIPAAIAALFGFLCATGLIMCWLVSRAPAGFETDDGFEYGEPALDDAYLAAMCRNARRAGESEPSHAAPIAGEGQRNHV